MLPETQIERDYLIENFNAFEVEPTSKAARDIIKEPGLFDLLHIACHGQASGNAIYEASLLMEGRVDPMNNYISDLFPERIARNFSNLLAGDNTPIVFVNACQTGKAGKRVTSVGGFADAFLSAGAGAFVGTLWSVGDAPASHFAMSFYNALREGKTLAQAANDGRAAARARDLSTWLAYEVYGHPYMKIKME